VPQLARATTAARRQSSTTIRFLPVASRRCKGQGKSIESLTAADGTGGPRETLMLNRIKRYFEQHLAVESMAQDPEHVLRLAIGALLLEMTHMDGEVWPEQRDTVEQAVKNCFDLSEREADELLNLAEIERTESTDYFQFTSLINRTYTADQKVMLVETLWRVAYANEALHKYEEHLVRKIADLLYVPHTAFIAAKHRARGDV
jgi:uncharacterized tellurite resistance protein B-like protein